MPADLEHSLRDLIDADETLRRFAAEDLAQVGDASAVAPLTLALGDPSAGVREAAIDALIAIGGEQTIHAMLAALRSEHEAVRNAACEVLRGIGPDAVDHLAGLLHDEDTDVRIFAIDTLAALGSPAASEALTAALADVNLNVAAAAATALGAVGARASVSALVTALKANSWVRCAVARSLGLIGGKEAASGLLTLLGDEDEIVVFTAVQGLGQVGGEAAFQQLLYLLEHPNPLIVAAVAEALEQVLSRLGPAAGTLRGAVPVEAALAALHRDDPGVQPALLRLLGQVAGESAVAPVTAVLLRACAIGDLAGSEQAAATLRAIGPRDVQPLLAALDTPHARAAWPALLGLLASLPCSESLPVLARRAEDPDPVIRRLALVAAVEAAGERAAALLMQALGDGDASVRATAVAGLGKLCRRDSQLDLVRALRDPAEEVQEAAARALALVGPPCPPAAVAALVALLEGPPSSVVETATTALAILAPEADPALARAAHGPARRAVLHGLAACAQTESAVGLLREAISDPEAEIATEALHALARLDGDMATHDVLAGLGHALPAVRRKALRALAVRPPGVWAQGLVSFLEAEGDPGVRYECTQTLAALAPPGVVDALLALLHHEQTPLPLLGALEALARLAPPEAVVPLAALAEHDEPDVREAARAALTRITTVNAAGGGS